MNAGKLRKLITIQQQSATQDEYGAQVVTWSSVGVDRWADVEQLQGREYFAGHQFQSIVDTRFVLRYVAGITPKMRILYNSLSYNIESVINVGERNTELHIMCSKITT
jgi:SPP1 family predicted phage head-tail adaptor